jgi:Tfp pilus assembly protein FimT
MGNRSRNRKSLFRFAPHFGVTAVELVVVVLILAIIAAAAVPRYADNLMRARVDAAARRIVADLAAAQARAKATSSNQTVTFVIPPQGSLYRIVGMNDPDRPGAAYAVDLTASPYQVTLNSVNLGNDTTLVYNGYGVPDSAGTIVVQAGNFTKTVTIDSSTGMAKIQ